jgi:hypothetical protein
MTFDEACELARVIEGTSRYRVIAVGRFVVQSELAAAYAGGFIEKLPWGVSVVAVDSPEYPKVLRSDDAWREFVACSNGIEKPTQAAATVIAACTRADAKVRGQLELGLF